jgi:hypothetical protein
MRDDAQQIALVAVENILDGARSFEVTVDGTKVTCSAVRAAAEPWPEGGVKNIPRPANGLWPAPVDVTCVWQGGKCTLRMEAALSGSGRYKGDVAIQVRPVDRGQQIVWFNLGARVQELEDGEKLPVNLGTSTAKRKKTSAPDASDRLNKAARTLLLQSGLPTTGKAKASAQACIIHIPEGTIEPSAGDAFQSFFHVALLKLDFIDRGEAAKARGKPLIDISKLGIDEKAIVDATGTEDDDDEESEDDASPVTPADLPLNLILYGPPGTGKTFTLQKNYFAQASPARRRNGHESEVLAEQLEDLYWYQVIALALHDIDKPAKLDEIVNHRYVQTHLLNNQAKKSSLPAMLSGNLYSHTVATNETVNVKRYGEALFDKE